MVSPLMQGYSLLSVMGLTSIGLHLCSESVPVNGVKTACVRVPVLCLATQGTRDRQNPGQEQSNNSENARSPE